MPNIKKGMMGAAGVSTGISGKLWTVGRGEDGSTGNEAVASTSSFAQIKTGISNWSGLCHGPPQRPQKGGCEQTPVEGGHVSAPESHGILHASEACGQEARGSPLPGRALASR